MQEEKNEKILINTREKRRDVEEAFESDEKISQDHVIIYREAEKPVRLTRGFNILLSLGIFCAVFILRLSFILLLIGIRR